MSAVFFDTNILVYAADAKCDQPAKRDVARTLVFSRRITVSTQVLMELYSALRRKLNFDHSAAMNWVQMLTKETVVEPTAKDMVAAIRMAQRFKISHWDGLILTAA
ncbi:MAG: PIN domain-containing protein, partial [Pseudomonadota bacterium]